MIKRKLEPLKKPINFNDLNLSDNKMIQYMIQMLKEQKRTNNILQQNSRIQTPNGYSVLTQQKKQRQSVSPQKTKKSPLALFEGNFQRQKPLISVQNQINKQQEYSSFPENSEAFTEKGLIQNAITNKIANEKKNYNVLNEFIPYTDRRQYKILVDFEAISKEFPVISNFQVLQKITIEWIGDVFRMVASMCWNMILNGFLTFDESKILFTQNIIYNYIEFMKELELRGFENYKHRLTTLINQKSMSILQFLGKQYPQTKIDVPNIRLKQILPKTNNSARMKFDVITIANKRGFQLKYKENQNYSVQIMQIINFIIDEVNESYPEYEKQCLHIFQQIFKIPEKRALASDGFHLDKIKQNQIPDSSQDIIYREKVKKYTKFLIGRKVNKNVPKFTREEINNGVFIPKSSSILRIITKWVEQLTEIVKDPQQHILSADRELKSHDGNFVILFSKARQAVCDKIKETRGKLFTKIQAIKQQCFYIESILSSPKYTDDSTQSHLSADQISVGKFSVCVQKAISAYIFQQLNEILGFLLKVPLEIDEKNIGIPQQYYQSEVRKQLDKLNLVTMKIFDLLRCKCISNEDQIIWIMKYLIERNLVGDFKLVRVKDRLSEGTRDINCNLRFKKGKFLSQMQLSVVSNIQSKQEKLDSYNHFLYQLKRSKLGPISENVSIWTVLEQRSLYFQKILRNPIPSKPVFHHCSNQNLQKFSRPICCQSCINFYPYPETVYSNVKCKKCKKTYCGECYSIVLSKEDKKSMIFQGLFKENILSHIKEHNDASEPFPTQGIYFKRYHQRREINFFTVLMEDSQTQKPMSFQSIKSLEKQQMQIPCQIIFTHNAIRNQKPIQKQKNVTQTIKAVLKEQKFLYINKNDYQFFKQYLVFYFDEKWKTTIMTLDQMQQFLKIQQNHGLKVLNIMEDPAYVDEIQYLRKRTQKLRQLNRLKIMFSQSPDIKFLTYQLGKIFIVAKVYKDSLQLGFAINYANNIAELKNYAYAQKSIISMQKHNLKDQLNNLQASLGYMLAQSLLKNLRKAYFNYNSLQNLTGLRNFIFLEVLYVRHNQIKSLQGIENMKQLILIRFDDNQVSSLEPLKSCTGLKRLMGNDNRITSLQPIKILKLLKTIEFEKNQIVSLEPIKQLQELEDINFKKNPQLKVIVQFSSRNIKSVSLSYTKITQLQILKNYQKIYKLMLQGLGLKKVPSFIKQLKLTELWLSNNQITQITNFDDQTQLQILSLKGNKLTSIKGLQYLEKIKTLYVQANQIKSLQGLKRCLQTLKYLNAKQNPLDDIKDITYADQTFKFQYTREMLSEKAKSFLDELYTSKVMSSGSED